MSENKKLKLKALHTIQHYNRDTKRVEEVQPGVEFEMDELEAAGLLAQSPAPVELVEAPKKAAAPKTDDKK